MQEVSLFPVGFLVVIYLSLECNLECYCILFYIVMISLPIIELYHNKKKYKEICVSITLYQYSYLAS